jgi:DNA-binding response OmpR family regulator
MMEIASAATVLGADHVLDKPFDSESLLAAINAVLVTPPPMRSQHGL